MRKLNNKGMSIVELIVSFAIITVAVVYFSQSLITVSKLFKNTKEETDAYVEEVYAYRTLEAMFKEYSANSQIGVEQSMWFLGFMNFGVYCDVDESNITNLFDQSPEVVYKVHTVTEDIIVDYQKIGGLGKSCAALAGFLDPFGTGASASVFKTADVWIPMNYYKKESGSESLLIKWFTGNSVRAYNLDSIKGTEFGFNGIKNFYNPKLKLFVSMAKSKDGVKIYKYITKYDYAEYKEKGVDVIYVIQNDWFQKIKDLFTGGIWESVSQFITNMVSKLGDAFDLNGFISSIDPDNAIEDIFSGIATVIETGSQDAKEAALGFVATIGDGIDKLSDDVKESISNMNEVLQNTFEDLGEIADKTGDVLGDVGDGLKEGLNKFINLFK